MNRDDAPIAQQASHDYLSLAADFAEVGSLWADVLSRAALAEIDDPEPQDPEWCDCTRCALYLSGAWRVIR